MYVLRVKKVTAVYLDRQPGKTIRIGRPKFRWENEKIYVQGSVYGCVHMHIVWLCVCMCLCVTF